jgi:hypothetical protein
VDDFLFIGGGGGGEDDYGFMVPAKQGWKHSPHHARVEKFMKKHNIKFILNVSHELIPSNRHHHRRVGFDGIKPVYWRVTNPRLSGRKFRGLARTHAARCTPRARTD